MDAEMKAALTKYGSTIKEHGSRAGEPIITKWEKKFKVQWKPNI